MIAYQHPKPIDLPARCTGHWTLTKNNRPMIQHDDTTCPVHENRHKDYTFTITVTTDTIDHANQVIAERLGHDEDYGFDYTITIP